MDSEIFNQIFIDAKLKKTNDVTNASYVLINTCGFILDAQEESVNTIIEFIELKKEYNFKLFVTGCLVKYFFKELQEELTEIDEFIQLKNFDRLKELLSVKERGYKRKLLTPNYYAYVRISDGCNNNCSYCVIPKIRGKHKSEKIENILSEVVSLVENGTKEIILLAQDTANYGIDIYGYQKLPELLDELNKIDKLKWLRILYLHPAHLTSEIIDAMARNNKVLKYFEIPLQHINNKVLEIMNRKITKEKIISLLNEIKDKISDAVIRTTFIVGHPGETEKRFEELLYFIKEQKFGRIGVFTYSKEKNTKSGLQSNIPAKKISVERRNRIMELQLEISQNFLFDYVGKEIEIIVENFYNENGFDFVGRSKFDAPEIDGQVFIKGKNLSVGSIVKAKVIDSWEYDLVVEII